MVTIADALTQQVNSLFKSYSGFCNNSRHYVRRTPDVYMKVILSEEYMGQFLSSEVLDVWLDGVKSFLCCIHSIRSESSLLASEALPLSFEVLDELDSSDAACCESPSRSVRSDSQEVTLRSREAYGHMAMASTSRLN